MKLLTLNVFLRSLASDSKTKCGNMVRELRGEDPVAPSGNRHYPRNQDDGGSETKTMLSDTDDGAGAGVDDSLRNGPGCVVGGVIAEAPVHAAVEGGGVGSMELGNGNGKGHSMNGKEMVVREGLKVSNDADV